MATTTTNYGFDVPTSSDLVKNGATQIALLGQDIDTFLFRPFTKNQIINGAATFWQRGTSFTNLVTGSYFADRWKTELGGTGVDTNSITRDTSVPNATAQYSMKMALTATPGSFLAFAARQPIETQQAMSMFGKSCTVSFWYRSNKTGSHGIRIIGSVQTGGTDQVTTFTVNAADTWEFKTVAVTAFSGITAIATGATDAGAYLDLGLRVGGTGAGQASATNGDYFQFTLVQLEIGTQSTPFTLANNTIAGELVACQRYYFRTSGANAYSPYGWGFAYSTSAAAIFIKHPTTMRTTPTALEYSSNLALGGFGAGTYTFSSLSLDQMTPDLSKINVNTTSPAVIQYRPYDLIANNNTSTYVGLSAEL
jgi:hypothetical protein